MYIEEGMPNDQETQVFFDGTRYLGQFKDGAAHGRGTITFSDGSIYTGQFENGEISGQGTMVFPDGSEYVGQFKDGMIHGQGTYTLPDGSRYVGMFKSDHFHGGVWDRAQGYDSQLENASPALEKKEHGVETKSMEGFVPSQAYPDTSVLDTAGRCEETQPAGDDLSFQTASGPAFSVQVGAFVSRNNAERLAAMLREKGYPAIILPMIDYYERSWYSVRLGSYSSFEEARKEAAAFSELEKLTATVRPVDAL